METLYRFLKSVKLAVVLILIIVVLSILATLAPQGEEAAFYSQRYPLPIANLIIALRFFHVFRSALFLSPCALLFVNLSVCAVDRIVRRLRARSKPRYGPDLVHLGLLLLLAGGAVTGLAKQEGLAYMGVGDEVELPGGYSMRLVSYVFEQYPDGREKDWISTVAVSRDGQIVLEGFPIEVNHPLRIAGIRVYQAKYGRQDGADMKSSAGETFSLYGNQGYQMGESFYYFSGIERDGSTEAAVFEKWEGDTRTEVHHLAAGEEIAGLSVVRLFTRDVSGLMAVKDPGFIPVMVALMVIAAGLALTFLQKQRDTRP